MQKKASFFLALAAVTITAASVWFVHRSVEPKQTTWDEVLAEAKAGGYRIITTEEVAGWYRKDPSGLLLVDTRQEWEFRTGHIEGALNFPIEPTWWARRRRAGELKAFLGPDQGRTLVFY
jgi:hypothetical protein